MFIDPELVRRINHKGKYFDVPGPAITLPSPQRTPLLLQAGTSRPGRLFAAQHAEAIFVSVHSPAAVAKSIAEVRQLAKDQFNRDPASIKVLAMICPILGSTEEEAQVKYADYRRYASSEGALALFGGWTGIDLDQYGDDEELRHVESNAVKSTVDAYARVSPQGGNGKWTKHTVGEHISIGGNGPVVVGTPQKVADVLEQWVGEADVDGFNFVSIPPPRPPFPSSHADTRTQQGYALFPQSFKDIGELLLPELRKRGLFWDDYAVPGGTYRENFYGQAGQKHPPEWHVASKYHWRAGVPAGEAPVPE